MAGNLEEAKAEKNGKGIGTQMDMNTAPFKSKHENITSPLEEVVTHEAYHSLRTDLGVSRGEEEVNPETGLPLEEEEAVRVQNIVRSKMMENGQIPKEYGTTLRTQYSDKKVHDPGRFVNDKKTSIVDSVKYDQKQALEKSARAKNDENEKKQK